MPIEHSEPSSSCARGGVLPAGVFWKCIAAALLILCLPSVAGALQLSKGVVSRGKDKTIFEGKITSFKLLATPSGWSKGVDNLHYPPHASLCDEEGVCECNEDKDCSYRDPEANVMDEPATVPGKCAGVKWNKNKVCVGHSDLPLLDEIYDLIAGAKERVDITSLGTPRGRFVVVIARALQAMANGWLEKKDKGNQKPPVVRMIFGNGLAGFDASPAAIYQALVTSANVEELKFSELSKELGLSVAVGTYRTVFKNTKLFSWNHAKIIAADGAKVIVGGHNLWGDDYLELSPASDVSMRLEGDAAQSAHAFVDQMWTYICKNLSSTTSEGKLKKKVTFANRKKREKRTGADVYPPSAADVCSGLNANPSITPSKSGATAIGVGRLGAIGNEELNQGDAAILELILSAGKTIKLSLQQLGPLGFHKKLQKKGITLGLLGLKKAKLVDFKNMGTDSEEFDGWGWPVRVINALVDRLAAKVDVSLIVGGPDGGSYEDLNGAQVTADYIGEYFTWRLTKKSGKEKLDKSEKELLCKHLHVAPLQLHDSGSWPVFGNGRKGFGNHAKAVMVDEAAFYIGSQNLYNSPLAEFGYIIDDVTAAKATEAWFDEMWKVSREKAVLPALCK
jgi:phosphatidylserine/phosphatidylglycerophosphate/cardiolipin synthase-like enzyme